MTKIHVVAWQYDTGAGFDWYYLPEHADAAYQEEILNAQNPLLKAEGWSAYRFDIELPFDINRATITDAEKDKVTACIDQDLDELCATTPIKTENILTEYGKVLSQVYAAGDLK